MAGKHGVEAIKQTVTVLKLGAIAILQATQKDGFQASDLFAPLNSPTFKGELEKAKDKIKEVLPELAELDAFDFFTLAQFGYDVFKDIQTELKPALAAVKRLEKKA